MYDYYFEDLHLLVDEGEYFVKPDCIHNPILIDFFILDVLEDENMSIILGRPFLNTVVVVVVCKKKQGYLQCQWKATYRAFSQRSKFW